MNNSTYVVITMPIVVHPIAVEGPETKAKARLFKAVTGVANLIVRVCEKESRWRGIIPGCALEPSFA